MLAMLIIKILENPNISDKEKNNMILDVMKQTVKN